MTGLYIHVPFCARKCPYCDFYSLRFSRSAVDGFTEAAVRNIQSFKGRNIAADTVYFGGGTPSLLSCEQVSAILDAVRDSFELSDAEITLEANPCTADFDKLCGYRRAGVNRLSFGVQSADDSELLKLGRLHNSERAQRAVEDAVKAGFENISCDLMLGTPGQTRQSLKNSVDTLTRLPIQHISAYMLRIEQGTPYDNEKIRNDIVDDELVSQMYLDTVEKLGASGFEQYEISNFAKAGFESRHNMKYWTGEDYIGIGPSAHSLFGARRYFCPSDLESFLSEPVQQSVTEDDDPDRLEEYVMLGLRLTKGISLQRLTELGVSDLSGFDKMTRQLEKAGLCVAQGDSVRLTPQGVLVSNAVIAELISSL